MKTIKTTLATIWIIWVTLLVGAILFASTPIDLNITNSLAAAWAFYGLTFGIPVILVGLNNFKIIQKKVARMA
jgi:Sec-independent protein secretion pathway component TatC